MLLAHQVNPFVRTSHYKALALLRKDLGSAYAVCTIFWGDVRRGRFVLKVASSLKQAKIDMTLACRKERQIYGANRVEWPGHFLHWRQQNLKTPHAFSLRVVFMLPDYGEFVDRTIDGFDGEVCGDHPPRRSKPMVTSNRWRTYKACSYETWGFANRMAARLED